jgi:hypothetical protein
MDIAAPPAFHSAFHGNGRANSERTTPQHSQAMDSSLRRSRSSIHPRL